MFQRRLSITSLFTLATLLPLVLLGLLLLALAVRTVNDSSLSLGRDILDESYRRVDQDVRAYLSHAQRLSDLLAELLRQGVFDSDRRSSWTERLFIRLRTTPEVGSICFTNESNDTIYLMRYPPDLEYGVGVGHGEGSTLWSYEARSDGKINPEPSRVYEYDPRSRIWWKLGHDSDEPVWTPAYQWFQTPERSSESVLSIALTRTVRDDRGDRLGVLSVDATLDQISRHLASVARMPGSFILITDEDGRLLASSLREQTHVLQPVAEMKASKLGAVRLAASVMNAISIKGDQFARVEVDSHRFWVRKEQFAIENGPKWMVTLAVPDEELLKDAKRAVAYMKIVGTVLMAAAVLVAILLARSVTMPLRRLATFAREVGGGKFEQRLGPAPTREFDELSQALNTMAANLEERLHLLAQKDAAQEATAMKSRLIAHVSHEFRTPLNAIMGYAEMLKEQARSTTREVAEQDLDHILLASRHLLTLVNNLLDISRVEAGQMPMDLVEFEVSKLVQDVCDTVRPVVESNGNVLEIRSGEAGARMVSDTVRIKQILINLLANASKFTSKGKIQLAVDVREDQIIFSVRDNGIGISPSQMTRLFEPFSQLQAGTRVPQVGAGLGLAISKQLAKLLGGSIELDSEIDIGTTATLKLPRIHPAFAQKDVR